MTRRGWLLVCTSVLCTTVAGYAVTRRWRAAPPATRDTPAEGELFQLINAERARYKYKQPPKDEAIQIPPLAEDKSLQMVAQAEAESMGRKQGMVYVPDDGLKQELQEAGYPFMYFTTLRAVVFRRGGHNWPETVGDWMKEAKHQTYKERLPNPYVSDIGIGVYRDGQADAYYVFMLLAKKQ